MSQGKTRLDDDALEVLNLTYQGPYRQHPVRIVMFDGDAWFIARDVCAVVHKSMMSVLFNGRGFEKDRLLIEPSSLFCKNLALPVSSRDGVWLLSERRFYEVVTWADDGPNFKRWVMHEVLPTIRHLNPHSNRREDLPASQETVLVRDLVRSDGSAGGSPDQPIRNRAAFIEVPLAEREQEGQHFLYRFFDAEDQLLYVGISWSAPARAKQHRADKDWWELVRRMTVEPHRSSAAARAAETRAIRTEHPMYNRAGVVKRGA